MFLREQGSLWYQWVTLIASDWMYKKYARQLDSPEEKRNISRNEILHNCCKVIDNKQNGEKLQQVICHDDWKIVLCSERTTRQWMTRGNFDVLPL